MGWTSTPPLIPLLLGASVSICEPIVAAGPPTDNVELLTMTTGAPAPALGATVVWGACDELPALLESGASLEGVGFEGATIGTTATLVPVGVTRVVVEREVVAGRGAGALEEDSSGASALAEDGDGVASGVVLRMTLGEGMGRSALDVGTMDRVVDGGVLL